ncbi:MAG: DMT family transporter [Candidatus Cloacimonadaceae bacterium]|nr:DMT family transporter [Candidatus Cloacimonadaceae bacterium]
MQNALTYIKASLAMLFWAVTFVWIKVALRWYRPIEIVLLRLVLASVLLFTVMLILRHKERIKREDLFRFLLVAFCEPFLYFLGEANGMQYVSSTLGSLIISTIPLVTAFGAWLLLKEKITPLIIIGLIVSFGGVALLSFESPDLSATIKGILYLLLAVFAGMFYGISVRSLTLKYTTLTIVTWQSFFGMLFFLPVFLINDSSHFFGMDHSVLGLVTIAAMSIFASVGAFMLFTGAIRNLGVIKANVFTNLIPVFTVILAYLLLGDKITGLTVVGLLLTISGLTISQLKDLKKLF